MKAIYCHRGEALDCFPKEDVAAGQVVSLGTRVGVTAAPILAGEQGAVHVTGVFSMAKAEGAAIEQGAAVFYDSAMDTVSTTEGGIPAGYAAASAAATDTTVLVKLLG